MLWPVAAMCAGSAFAQTTQSYTDTTGDVDANIGTWPHLDITSVDVTVSADETTITFKINLAGSPMDTAPGVNWGKYLVGIRSGAGGSTTSNAWASPISMDGGMTHFIGTWADAGSDTCGGDLQTYSGTWGSTATPVVTKDATGITIVANVSDLSLSPGETFSFDVYSSGGGGSDSAVDALSAAAASITGWSGPYATGVVGGTNGALTFTMPGTSDFATWIQGFGLAVADQDPGDDPDVDGLTNQQEFDLDLGLDPNSDDTDGDFLLDGVETATGVYVDANDTGTLPAVQDTDGDGYIDGDEVDMIAFGYVSDPNVKNFDNISVAGNFTNPQWVADGSTNGTDMMRTADTDLIGQYGWTLDYKFEALGAFAHKFTGNHGWTDNWGSGGANGADIGINITATGIHRWTFNSRTTNYTFDRVTFPDAASYLAAYGLTAGGDADMDNILNEDEFAANTDPTNADTDGDGVNDDIDPLPLLASRTVTFSVNMNVQQQLGNFTPGTNTVLVAFFNGNVGNLADLTLSDGNSDGIYDGSIEVPGAEGASSGGYKFIIDPGYNYESGNDRTFTLGVGNTAQVLPTVYFSDVNAAGGYSTWATTNAGGQTAAEDFDGDGMPNGVEYFMGETGSGFTANPALNAMNTITWPRDPAVSDAVPQVLISEDLQNWTDVTADANVTDPSAISYTLPTTTAKRFVRLKVEVP